eukprot:1140840-Pelagomonas_calceolata.AAC.14
MLGGGNLRAAQLESIKAQLLKGLGTLRNLREEAVERGAAGGVGKGAGAQADLARLLDGLAAQLTDCQQVRQAGVSGAGRVLMAALGRSGCAAHGLPCGSLHACVHAVEAVLQDTRRDAAQQQQQQQQGGAGQLGPQPTMVNGQGGASTGADGGTGGGGGGGGIGGRLIRGPGGGSGRFEGLVGGRGAGRGPGVGPHTNGGGGVGLQQQQQQQQQSYHPQGDFLADAMADELRAKLREMAKQVAELQIGEMGVLCLKKR